MNAAQAFSDLTESQQRHALFYLVGALSTYATDRQYANAIEAARRDALGEPVRFSPRALGDLNPSIVQWIPT